MKIVREFKNVSEVVICVFTLALVGLFAYVTIVSFINEGKYRHICENLSGMHQIMFCDYKINPDKTTYWAVKPANRGGYLYE